MNIVVVGLSHKTSPVEIREKLSIKEDQIEEAITRLCNYPHICEAAILSTCNRMEIYVALSSEEHGVQDIYDFLFEYTNLSADILKQHLFTLFQQDAVLHLMQVASGLDSLIIGEGQILGQVKHAYKLGHNYNGVRNILHQLFKQSITVAKRVRTHTCISSGATSVSAAAVELAITKIQHLFDCRIVIIGAGKMARLLVKHLLSKGAKEISIINLSIERARELANQFNEVSIKCYPLTELIPVIMNSDLVFTSTSSTQKLLNKTKLKAFSNSNRSLMIIDISVPRNVDADVNELNNIEVFNVDDLKTVIAQNQDNRRKASIQAQYLIKDELEKFSTWFRSLETVSIISCFREKVEKIREQELEKTLCGREGESLKKHRKILESLTKGIVNKIIHEPMVQVRTQQDIENQRIILDSFKVLFDLDLKEKCNYQNIIQNKI